MKFAALVLIVLASACANGIEIPDNAVYMGQSEEWQAETESWTAMGLGGEPEKCPVPYIAKVTTTEFEAHWLAIGGAQNYPSCGRKDGSVNRDGYCLGAYTELDPSAAEHSSVIYVDENNGISHEQLMHEVHHILYGCTRGHGDPLHEDRPAWVGETFAVPGW